MSDDSNDSLDCKSEGMSKAQRLAIAGAIAPTLRTNAARAKSRRVKVTDKAGKVIKEVSLAEVQEGLLAAQKIEFDVEDGVRPKTIACARCGKVMRVRPTGLVPSYCSQVCKLRSLRAERPSTRLKTIACLRCGKLRNVLPRNGIPKYCGRSCSRASRLGRPIRPKTFTCAHCGAMGIVSELGQLPMYCGMTCRNAATHVRRQKRGSKMP